MSFPHRSVLFMPGANTRALEKAATLACDGVILDLEDAVAPASKDNARTNVVRALETIDYGHRERIVRVNGLDTPWGADDVAALAGLQLDAVLFPKIDSAAMANAAAAALDTLVAAGGPQPALWVMIESPASIVALESICLGCERLAMLVVGTSDLVRDMRAQHLPDRAPVLYALSKSVTVGRAFGLEVLDGVHLDFRNLDTFRSTCEQGRAMGFDGRTLIHPGQIEIANEVYGLSAEDVAHAHRVVAAWQQAEGAGLGVVDLDGQLVESMHAAEAERVIALSEKLQQRDNH